MAPKEKIPEKPRHQLAAEEALEALMQDKVPRKDAVLGHVREWYLKKQGIMQGRDNINYFQDANTSHIIAKLVPSNPKEFVLRLYEISEKYKVNKAIVINPGKNSTTIRFW